DGVEQYGEAAAVFRHRGDAGIGGVGITSQLRDFRDAHALVLLVAGRARPSHDDAVPSTVLVYPGLEVLVLLDAIARRFVLEQDGKALGTSVAGPHREE